MARDALDEITSHDYFKNTIYLVNPSLLYTLANLDLISYKDGVVTFMLSFPFIRRRYDYKSVTLLESPRTLLLHRNNFDKYHKFMLPIELPLNELDTSTTHLRSMKNCIITRSFTACDGNSLLDYEEKMCLHSLMVGVDTHCYTRIVPVFDFNIEYLDQYAFVYLKNNTSVVHTLKKQTLYETANNEEKCLLISKEENLIVKSSFRKENLFPYDQLYNFKVKNDDLVFTHVMEPQVIENFTKPLFNLLGQSMINIHKFFLSHSKVNSCNVIDCFLSHRYSALYKGHICMHSRTGHCTLF